MKTRPAYSVYLVETHISIKASAERVWSLLVDFPAHQRWNPFVRFLLPGLLDGEHYFKIEPLAGGEIMFHQGEMFSGVLVPLFKWSLNGPTKQGFIAMNAAIKRLAEDAGHA